MTRFKVVTLARAEADIESYFLHIAADSPRNAQAWVRGVRRRIGSLSTFPLRCAKSHEADELNLELRETYYHSHRILFTVVDDVVRVVAVRHTARDDLGEESPEMDG